MSTTFQERRRKIDGEPFSFSKSFSLPDGGIVGATDGTIKPLYTRYILGFKFTAVNDPELVTYMLRKENKLIIEELFSSIQNIIGKRALSVVQGKQHDIQRKLFNQSFMPNNIQLLLPSIQRCTSSALEQWTSNSTQNYYNAVKKLTLDIALLTVFGDKSTTKDELSEMAIQFTILGDGLFSLPINLPFTKYGKAMRARQVLISTFKKKIEQIRSSGAFQSDEESVPLFESMLMAENTETNERFTDEEIQDNCINILYAAHDTTSSAIAYLILILHCRPDIVEELRKEQDVIQSKYGDEYTITCLKEMKYLDALIYETLRRFLVIGVLFKSALVDFELPGYDYHIKKGERLLLGIRGSHYYANPNEYFTTMEHKIKHSINLQEVVEKLKDDHLNEPWLPFSEGKRKCLGKPLVDKELRIVIAELVRSYDLELVADDRTLFDENNWTSTPFFHPKLDIPLKLTKRSSNM